MLRIDRDGKTFLRLETPSLSEASITERYDLQEYICNSPDAFFQEIGQSLFLIAKEVQPSSDVEDRIDILALDKEGQAVVIELKRGNNKLQMFQAISYAGMVSSWQPQDFFSRIGPELQEKLTDFLEVENEQINIRQRIILVAEAYDYSVLVGAEWLTEKFGVDILCCRLSLANDNASSAEYLVCSNIFPAPEIAQQAIRRGRNQTGRLTTVWSDWDTALSEIVNQRIVEFYRNELQSGVESYLPRRQLRYRSGGKRRWVVNAHRQRVYVWQEGRFEDDIHFWRSGISEPDEVKAVKNDQCIRFFLITAEDFEFFKNSFQTNLQHIYWIEGSEEEMDAGEVQDNE